MQRSSISPPEDHNVQTQADGSDTETLTVMMVDGETLVRSALAHLLRTQEGVDVVADASEAKHAIAAARGHKPNVIVYDPHHTRNTVEAVDLIHQLLEASPESAVVVLTSREDPIFARELIRAGALGYMLMSEDPEEVLKAIRRASSGRPSLSPKVAMLIAGADSGNADHELTERERDIVHLVALGHTNKEMAEELHLSIRTVESHRANILRKLDVTNRAGLVRYALDNNLLD